MPGKQDAGSHAVGDKVLLKDESYALVGCAMEVYNTLGIGFLEAVYQEAMEIELAERGVPFESQKQLRIKYKNRWLNKFYVADLVGYGKIVVELKCVPNLGDLEIAQALNYLKATGQRLCILINFGRKGGLQYQRVVV